MNNLIYIDTLKTIGILLIIIGHIIDYNGKFFIYLHSFNVQLFFFISGYLFHKYTFKELFNKKINRLIKPYINFGILNFILCFLIYENFNSINFISSFCFYNNNPPIPCCGALWFLTCLFFTNIIFYFLEKTFKNFVFLPIILLTCLEYIFKIKLPFSIDSAIFMLPIFYFGYIFKTQQKTLKENQKILICTTIFIFTIFTTLINGLVNVRINQYSNIILFYFNAILLSIGYFYFANIIQNYTTKFNWIGKNSLEFMCIHQIILYAYKIHLNITSRPILFFATFSTSALLIYLFKTLPKKMKV